LAVKEVLSKNEAVVSDFHGPVIYFNAIAVLSYRFS
jgi:hypothetical protein